MPNGDAPQILRGRLTAFFAFDVAYAIDLAAIPQFLNPERAQLVGSRRAPEYVRYVEPPVEVALAEHDVKLPGGTVRAKTTARLFEFGAISIAFVLPLPESLAGLPALADALADADLGAQARKALEELVGDVRPAMQRAGFNDISEDYYVFELHELAPALSAETLLREHASVIAATVAMDASPLAPSQIQECLREPISYSPTDLVAANWNAAFVYDAEPIDTRAVLEYLNVQLVELRFLDARLDRALLRFSSAVYRGQTLLSAFRGPQRLALRALSELLVEVSTLSERVENALKLAPDVYLARVHRRSATCLGLPTWGRMVQSKLDALRHLATVLTDRAAARRAEALEITIIVLIALEIVLALAGRLPL